MLPTRELAGLSIIWMTTALVVVVRRESSADVKLGRRAGVGASKRLDLETADRCSGERARSNICTATVVSMTNVSMPASSSC